MFFLQTVNITFITANKNIAVSPRGRKCKYLLVTVNFDKF